ncbi:atypical/ABC1/ABC1-B protein kinase [Schizosaccharomyces japonicus yFS275]|uniref:Atypical/ABC1/ABC1-B protein kinase n=1 Tax=Schizosaccharomyces japonicus (strain yFS275 / FY16936) TaxID=402676 RepID=B6JZM1_SCHJY|nr:atypical/ABC1/ABC1-B protein kinase [Schizosaccharomyces japonicus yFS275]EEB06989.2 atypical/ABC1/ABC1-B protein kinase [Schizosaccharomyces japonicus yFS275]
MKFITEFCFFTGAQQYQFVTNTIVIKPQEIMFSRLFRHQSFRKSFSENIRRFSFRSRYNGSNRTRFSRKNVTVGVGVTLVASAVLVDFDPIKHAGVSSLRAYRVVYTGFVCFSDYKKVLTDKYETPEDRKHALSRCHLRCAKRTLKVFEENGGIYIKVGQHLSVMDYIIPKEWTETLIPLQDQCPMTSVQDLDKLFFKDTGKHIDEYFEYFDPKPVGVASLAQVHKAKLKNNGQLVAVKIQHPPVSEFCALDLSMTRWVFKAIKYFFPDYNLFWISDEIEKTLPQELDFTMEAKNAQRTRDHFAKIKTALYIPEVVWADNRILVMEFVKGSRIDDMNFYDTHDVSREQVSLELCHIFNEMIFGKGGHLHCDPHGGNVFIREKPKHSSSPRNFEIVLLDHGLYRDIPLQLQRDYARMWLSIINFDETSLRYYAKKVANVDDAKFSIFASAITGRDYKAIKEHRISSRRGLEERDRLLKALDQTDLLGKIIQLLSDVPRTVLLLMKTNDLVRSLDDNLQTRSGPEKLFLIMARYCLRTVHEEDMEKITQQSKHQYYPSTILKKLGCSVRYWFGCLRYLMLENYFYYKNLYF